MSASLVSIVLPVYRQADHVGVAVREFQEALTKLARPYELLLVVNGTGGTGGIGATGDRSLEVCRELESQSSTIRVLESDRPGWGRAVLLGLEAARGELCCYTNLARTSAEDLTLLLLYATVHPNVVVKANRKIRDSTYRRLGSLVYNLECRALFDLSYWDINGTPKVFPRSFSKLFALTHEDDLIDAEFNIVCRQEGYPVLEVPIFAGTRRGGRSTTNHRSAFRMYWGALRMWRGVKAPSKQRNS